jgi:hypothetical protein
MEEKPTSSEPEQIILFDAESFHRKPTAAEKTVTPYEIVRPEINLEKHADLIFSPSHSRDLSNERSRSWEKKLPNGHTASASIVVQTYKNRRPTVKTRKVYLGLNKLQELKGFDTNDFTTLSFRELADVLAIGWHGSTTVREFTRELYQLRFNPFIVRGIFEKQHETIEREDSFTILQHLRIVRRKDRNTKEYFDAMCEFGFHEYLQDHLRKNRTKPTLLIAARLQGEIASLLYARLDLFLAEHDRYERRTEGLFFEDLGLVGKKYFWPSGRKQNLKKAVDELNGKPISTGILNVIIERTADGKDYKLVAWKTEFPPEVQPLINSLIKSKRLRLANPQSEIPYIIEDMEKTLGHHPSKKRLFELIAKRYPHFSIISHALSEYRADKPTNHHPLKYFQTILHRLAHHHGYDWIRPCTPECELRRKAQ